MHPVLFSVGAWEIRSYAVFVLLGFLAAWRVRRVEVARLGHQRLPGYAWVPVGALLGAIVGSKLGMLLFERWADWSALMARMVELDFTGKTVVGALAGGYLGVEIAKKRVGITRRTGDGFAVAMLVGMAVGRVGCFLEGCCAGVPWDGPLAVDYLGAARHPAPLYEGALDLLLAAVLWRLRGRAYPEGNLYRRALVGYAIIRFCLEPIRVDYNPWWGWLSGVQLVCLATAVGFGAVIVGRERGRPGAQTPASGA